jgi:type IV fimbrial biogenesis protein FimT
MPYPKLARGATLTELATVLAVVAVLATLATPSFRTIQRNVALRSASDQFFVALHQARSTSILRNVPAVVCATADGASCLVGASRNARGYLSFLQRSPGTRPQRSADAELLLRAELPMDVEMHTSRAGIVFWPASRAGATGTFLFCDTARLAAPRAVIVSRTGRPRQSSIPPPSSVLRCDDAR